MARPKYLDQLFGRLGDAGARWPVQAQHEPADAERIHMVQDGKSIKHGSVDKEKLKRFADIHVNEEGEIITAASIEEPVEEKEIEKEEVVEALEVKPKRKARAKKVKVKKDEEEA